MEWLKAVFIYGHPDSILVPVVMWSTFVLSTAFALLFRKLAWEAAGVLGSIQRVRVRLRGAHRFQRCAVHSADRRHVHDRVRVDRGISNGGDRLALDAPGPQYSGVTDDYDLIRGNLLLANRLQFEGAGG